VLKIIFGELFGDIYNILQFKKKCPQKTKNSKNSAPKSIFMFCKAKINPATILTLNIRLKGFCIIFII